MSISTELYRDCFHEWDMRFYFVDCAVRDRNIFMFSTMPLMDTEQMKRHGDLPPQTIVGYIRNEGYWGVSFLQLWHKVVLGTSLNPLGHSVSIEPHQMNISPDDRKGYRVFVTGSGEPYEDSPLKTYDRETKGADGAFERGTVEKLKMIDGWLYVCGGNRAFGKRLEKGKWESFTQCFPFEYNTGKGGWGFADFDAFNEQDIYLAGGRGDVWHFDGKKARQIPIPTNVNLETVCCGGDGEVYISGSKGMTFHGRGDRWERVENEEPYEDPSNLSFRDMVWYEDKVWATNPNGLWVIENNTIKEADVPHWVRACKGTLSVGDGVLLLAGSQGAVFRENGEWHKILLFDEMEALLK